MAGRLSSTAIAFGAAFALVGGVSLVAQQNTLTFDVEAVIHRAAERVQQYFARAQSLVCTEIVGHLPVELAGLSRSRMIESELRLSWQPTPEDPLPKEARTLRQVLRVNGHPPRKNDHNNCTAPEQQASEEQPLSMLLPLQRPDYLFKAAGTGEVDGRRALLVDYRMIGKPVVKSELVNDNENCVSFSVDGGMRGRLWIDAVTYDVLRLDKGLIGLIDIPLPRKVANRDRWGIWTMERWDTSMRFKPVTFEDPVETLVLPVSATSYRITRGSGTPRLRTTTEYRSYRRFLTGGRVVPPG